MPNESIFDLPSVSRRRFLQGSALTAGVVAASPYLSRLEAFAAPPVADNQGILLTIFLAGGNDGLNMVAPVAAPAYATLRPTLKIANTLPVGSGLALHPALVKLKSRFDSGKVAIVRGVGYQPPDLSHFSSSDIWMHGWGGAGTPTTGWLGRYLDGLPNTDHESLYGVALHGGVNLHLAGAASQASSLPLNLSNSFGIDRTVASDARLYDALISLGSGLSGLGPLGDLYDTTESDFLQLAQRIHPAYGFTDQPTDISQQLVLAAHLINANLGIRVFDTELDGFDTHSGQGSWHATLLGRLDDAIDAFFRTLAPRWRTQVTVMTFSEFGRRPEENGDHGTDHGTAAPVFVIGDHVKGGLHGTQPSLTALDDNGNFVPSVDFRALYANVLDGWLGADGKSVVGKTYSDLSLFKAGPAGPFTGSESGYWLAGPTGGVHGFGRGIKFGSVAHAPNPIAAGASTLSHGGMWLTGVDGRVFCFGDAKPFGSFAGRHLYSAIIGIAATPTGKGYWLASASGGVFCFGDAKPHGSMAGKHVSRPIVDVCSTPSGKGYWLVTNAGGVYTFGDAYFHGSGVKTPAPVVTLARTASGNGYWMAAKDGTVGAFGDAPVLGSIKAPTAVLVRC